MPFSFDSPFQTGSSIWSSQSQWIFTAPPYLLYMRLLGPKKRYLRLLYRCRGCYDTKNDTWGCLIAVEAATTQKTIPEAALSLWRLIRHKKRYLRLLYRCGGYYDTKKWWWETPAQFDMGWRLAKNRQKSADGFSRSFASSFAPSMSPLSQCVELKLRWQFCVHTSTCHEIYF